MEGGANADASNGFDAGPGGSQGFEGGSPYSGMGDGQFPGEMPTGYGYGGFEGGASGFDTGFNAAAEPANEGTGPRPGPSTQEDDSFRAGGQEVPYQGFNQSMPQAAPATNTTVVVNGDRTRAIARPKKSGGGLSAIVGECLLMPRSGVIEEVVRTVPVVGTPVSLTYEDKFVSLGPLVDEMLKKQGEFKLLCENWGKDFDSKTGDSWRIALNTFTNALQSKYLMDDEQSEAVSVLIATKKLRTGGFASLNATKTMMFHEEYQAAHDGVSGLFLLQACSGVIETRSISTRADAQQRYGITRLERVFQPQFYGTVDENNWDLVHGAWIKYISYELIKSDASAPFKEKYFVKKGVAHDGKQKVLEDRTVEPLQLVLSREQTALNNLIAADAVTGLDNSPRIHERIRQFVLRMHADVVSEMLELVKLMASGACGGKRVVVEMHQVEGVLIPKLTNWEQFKRFLAAVQNRWEALGVRKVSGAPTKQQGGGGGGGGGKERICDFFSRHGRCSYAEDGALACRNGKHVRVQQPAGGGAGGGKGGGAGGGNVGANAPRKTPSNAGGLPTPAPKGGKGGQAPAAGPAKGSQVMVMRKCKGFPTAGDCPKQDFEVDKSFYEAKQWTLPEMCKICRLARDAARRAAGGDGISGMPVAVEEEEEVVKDDDEVFQEELQKDEAVMRQVEVMIPGVFVIGDEAGVEPAPAAEPVKVSKEDYVDDPIKNAEMVRRSMLMFNPLSGDLYGDDARRWQEEEKERLQVAEAIEQVAVAMKKAAEEEAAAVEEEEDMDEVGYGGPKVGLTLFQCMWVNAEIRDCIVSFVLDGRDMSKGFVEGFLPAVKKVKKEIGAVVLEITSDISAEWKQEEEGRAARKIADSVCQAVQKGVKAVSEKKNGVRKYKSRRVDVEVFVKGAGKEIARKCGFKDSLEEVDTVQQLVEYYTEFMLNMVVRDVDEMSKRRWLSNLYGSSTEMMLGMGGVEVRNVECARIRCLQGMQKKMGDFFKSVSKEEYESMPKLKSKKVVSEEEEVKRLVMVVVQDTEGLVLAAVSKEKEVCMPKRRVGLCKDLEFDSKKMLVAAMEVVKDVVKVEEVLEEDMVFEGVVGDLNEITVFRYTMTEAGMSDGEPLWGNTRGEQQAMWQSVEDWLASDGVSAVMREALSMVEVEEVVVQSRSRSKSESVSPTGQSDWANRVRMSSGGIQVSVVESRRSARVKKDTEQLVMSPTKMKQQVLGEEEYAAAGEAEEGDSWLASSSSWAESSGCSEEEAAAEGDDRSQDEEERVLLDEFCESMKEAEEEQQQYDEKWAEQGCGDAGDYVYDAKDFYHRVKVNADGTLMQAKEVRKLYDRAKKELEEEWSVYIDDSVVNGAVVEHSEHSDSVMKAAAEQREYVEMDEEAKRQSMIELFREDESEDERDFC